MGMAKRFTHRNDPRVPAFEDSGHIVFIDGACGLCSRSARSLAKADHAGLFKIATIQSALGRAVLIHYGLDPDDPASWLYLHEGTALEGSDAIIAVATHLSAPLSMLRFLRLIPRRLREAGYHFIARHRYKLLGRKGVCDMPDQALRDRLL